MEALALAAVRVATPIARVVVIAVPSRVWRGILSCRHTGDSQRDDDRQGQCNASRFVQTPPYVLLSPNHWATVDASKAIQ